MPIVRRATIKDVSALQDFYKIEFPDKPVLHDMQVWEWTFTKNQGENSEVSFYILEDEEKICGGIGYIPVTLVINEKEFTACHPVNYFVSPKYKGLAALRLMRKVLNDFPIQFASYVSDDAARLFKSAGFVNLSNGLKNYYLPIWTNDKNNYSLSFAEFIKKLILHVTRTTWLSILKVLSIIISNKTTIQHSGELSSEIIPESVTDNASYIGIKKDFKYLKWRYSDSPRLNCIYFFGKSNHSPDSMIVLHLLDNKNEAVILDVIPSPSMRVNIKLLLSIFEYCKEKNISMLSTSLTNKKIAKLFRLFGFSSSPSSYRFMVYSRGKDMRNKITDPENWGFYIGNTDVY